MFFFSSSTSFSVIFSDNSSILSSGISLEISSDLLSSFLSPLTNQRTDEYGGSFEKRLLFPLQIVDAVRTVWNKPLAIALNVDDWAKGGLIIDEAVNIAREMIKRGCDLLQPLAGQTIPNDKPIYGAGYLTAYAEQLRHETGLPIMVGGHLTSSGESNTILAGGRADICIIRVPEKMAEVTN